jgi:hypothetical protein
MGRTAFLLGLQTWLCLFLLSGGPVNAADRVTIGLVEEIILLPWGVKMPARIDTGAATSSLDVRDLTVKEKVVAFRLPEKYGGTSIRLPVKAWQVIRSAETRERRPVVEVDLCVGPKQLRARVNLNNRSQVQYPFLIGRNILQENFLVDCMKEFCNPPSCPVPPPK